MLRAVSDPTLQHNARVIAGTFAGFEAFQSFHASLLDPLKTLLPLAVEVEAVAMEAGALFQQHLISRGFFVDAHDLERGILRVAGPFDRFEVFTALCRELPPDLRALAKAIETAVAARFVTTFDLPAVGRTLHLGRRPLVMGVLNITPDSFSDGGRFAAPDRAIERAFQLEAEGADVIDLGAESTRPGAAPVSAHDEWARLEPVLRVIGREMKAAISIDTMKSEVAERALDAGAVIVNDVSGLEFDPRLVGVVAQRRAGLVLNHMRGTPRTMQEAPRYDDSVAEIAKALRERLFTATEAGVAPVAVLLDPGIGFGKRVEDNLDVLARLSELRSLGRPLVIGCSRKSFLGHVTGRESGDRAFATAATTALAALRGVKMIRVHDVRETRDVLSVLDAVDGRIRLA
jgi:dihydropteroate synthase